MDLFLILANDVRIRILEELAEEGECTFVELTKTCWVSTGTLAYHLSVLKELVSKKGNKYCLTEKGYFAYELVAQVKDFEHRYSQKR